MHSSKETLTLQSNPKPHFSPLRNESFAHPREVQALASCGFGKYENAFLGVLYSIDSDRVSSEDALHGLCVGTAGLEGEKGNYEITIFGHVRTFTTVTPQPPSYGSPSRNSAT